MYRLLAAPRKVDDGGVGAFWRGYSSALSVCPNSIIRKRRAWRILLDSSSSEAIGRDWVMVGRYLHSAIAEADERLKHAR
jgi:hypothetical protein